MHGYSYKKHVFFEKSVFLEFLYVEENVFHGRECVFKKKVLLLHCFFVAFFAEKTNHFLERISGCMFSIITPI